MTIDKQWVVYIVECSDKTLYTGITNNLTKRIATHNKGCGAKYTKSRLPVILFWHVNVPDKSSALKLEYKIKQLSKADKINLVNDISYLPIP